MGEEIFIEAGKELAKSALKSLAKKAIKKLYTPSKKTLKRRARRQKRQAARQAQREAFKQARLKKRQEDQIKRDLKGKYNPPAPTTAQELNKMLKHAEGVYGGYGKYGDLITGLLWEIMGDQKKPEAGDITPYYEISEDYTGKLPELFRYITFKDIPETNNNMEWVQLISDQPWSTPEQYEQWIDDWHHKSYLSNLKEPATETIGKLAGSLEYIMNTSAAWHIAQRGADDSTQVKSQWSQLYRKLTEARELGGDKLFDQVVAMIENEDYLESIIEFVDTEIMGMIQE